MVAFGGHWKEPKGYIYMVWLRLKILVNLEFVYIVCLCLLTNPFSQRMVGDLRYTSLISFRFPMHAEYQPELYESCYPSSSRGKLPDL